MNQLQEAVIILTNIAAAPVIIIGGAIIGGIAGFLLVYDACTMTARFNEAERFVDNIKTLCEMNDEPKNKAITAKNR